MRGARKSRLGCRRIANIAVEDDIREVLAGARRSNLNRVERLRDRRQCLVGERDRLGRIFRLRHALRDDAGDDLADMADFRPNDRLVLRPQDRRSIPVLDADIGRMRVRDMRQRVETVGLYILGRQHRQHPGHRARLRRIDAAHPGMRVRRAHHDRIGLARQIDIVAIAAAPGQQAQIFAPPDRLPDPCACCRTVHRSSELRCHCEERSDEAIPFRLALIHGEIASLRSQ